MGKGNYLEMWLSKRGQIVNRTVQWFVLAGAQVFGKSVPIVCIGVIEIMELMNLGKWWLEVVLKLNMTVEDGETMEAVGGDSSDGSRDVFAVVEVEQFVIDFLNYLKNTHLKFENFTIVRFV